MFVLIEYLAKDSRIALIEKKSITVSKYLNLMKSAEKEMVKLLSYGFGNIPLIKESRNPVAVTWLVSKRLRDLMPLDAVFNSQKCGLKMVAW